MSSFIFSFRAILLALGVIAATEGVCALALRPGIVERTKFNLLDRFHSAVIFGKLADFANSAPDIIQVGDSSGFHSVQPDLVMRYLGGLKYVNLSCCAALGYRGYYGIADFMLRRNPGVKAVVLYVSLNNLPRADLIEGQHQLGEFIQNSLTTPFSYLSPATVALRQRIVDATEKKGQARTDAVFTDDMRASAREHNGWWAEHDRRLAGDKRTAFWRATCGEIGVKTIDPASYYAHDGQSYMVSELERFATLAARHEAKLIVMFQPFSCRGLDADFLDARLADVRTLLSRHRNVSVVPEQVLEAWPTEKFVSGDHLRVGYDEENSMRVGKALARVLGTDARVETPVASEPGKPADTINFGVHPVTANWPSQGAAVIAEGGPAVRIIEAADARVHHVERKLAGLTPGKILLLSLYAKAIGARGIFVEVLAAGRRSGGYCDLPGGTAQRDGDMLDAGLDPAPRGWWRCWVATAVTEPAVTLRLSLINERLDPVYPGDGSSGVGIAPVEPSETTRFLAQEASPW